MAQKKETEKKDVKVQDLAPKKDAKGGAARNLDGGRSLDGRSLDGSKSLDGGASLDGRSSKSLN
jgi:hypothetical protein